MNWRWRYQLRHFLNTSIWFLPTLAIFAGIGITRGLVFIDHTYGLQSRVAPDSVRALLGTIAASLFTFIVFVSSALLVAVQLASAQLTPRVIAVIYGNPMTRAALTVFVLTFTISLAAIVHIEDHAPYLTTQVAAYGCVASLIVFLILIDHVGKSLRPSGALRAVAVIGRTVIKSVYPLPLSAEVTSSAPINEGPVTRMIPCRSNGVVLAFDAIGLVGLAEKYDCMIELVPQVGDHVPVGDPLFRLYRGGDAIPAKMLHHSVAFGVERTMEQDPTFAFRIMVDIASKGLSPAINDPTTGVLAIDQIHYLLRYVGGRDLDTGMVRDRAGRLRLLYRTPDWEDFVRLAVTEIRHFGGESIQIARRLRAMLENLIQNLPESRGELLRKELSKVGRSSEKCFTEPDDRALADECDAQGVGGRKSRT
ncbi:MAG: DUF2254 domain-containing protein [Gemmataceae bacterium]|nr:DUF2254 domain-containing protein [Gemmataceae bacterium]